MNTMCFAIGLCAVMFSYANAATAQENTNAVRVLASMERVEERLGTSFGTIDSVANTQSFGAAADKPAKASLGAGLKGDKTVRIMKHKVRVSTIKMVAKTLWTQKLSIKVKF